MTEHIKAALQKLDPSNDNHWTADGAARLETVRFVAHDNSITREQVNAAVPGFSRSTAPALAAQQPQAAQQPVAATVPAPAAPAHAVEPATAPQMAVPQPVLRPARPQDIPPVPEGYSEADLREMLQDANASLQEALKSKGEAEKAVAYATKIVDRLVDALTKKETPSDFANTVQDYLRTQAALREQRAQRIAATKNIDLSTILPQKSKLDKSFERKVGYGHNRPDFNKKP